MKKILAVVLMALMLAVSVQASLNIHSTGPTTASTFCQIAGNTVDLNVVGTNEDGNLFRVRIGDVNLGIADGGSGNKHPDFNAFYMASDHDMNIIARIPASIGTGNQTITISDLNKGAVIQTVTVNIKPTWTATDVSTNVTLCTLSSYAAISGFKLTDNSGNGYGFIEFTTAVDLSAASTNFDTALVEWTATKLTFSSSTLNGEPADIQFSKAKLVSKNPKMLRNNDNCDQCNLLEANGDAVKFNTTAGFSAEPSVYEVLELTSGGATPSKQQILGAMNEAPNVIMLIFALAVIVVGAVILVVFGKKKKGR